MLFFSPLIRLTKIESALGLGIVLLLCTSLGLLSPDNTTLMRLGLDQDIFFSWWYLSLEILLATSLISCTVLDQIFVLRCHSNTTKKFTGVELNISNQLSSVPISQIKKGLPKIRRGRTSILQKELLREWAPLGIHGLVAAMATYGALDMLYSFRGFGRLSVGEGMFLSESAAQQSSSVHVTPLGYGRVNDSWVLVNPYQPFLDLSLLDMNGEEYTRFTVTTSSRSVSSEQPFSVGLPVDGSLSLTGLTPKRIRLTDAQNIRWEIPALAVDTADQRGWLAYSPEDELLIGQQGGSSVLVDKPNIWGQQDMYEKSKRSIGESRLVDVISDTNISWTSNQLSIEVFFLPLLFTLMVLLIGTSKDIYLTNNVLRPR